MVKISKATSLLLALSSARSGSAFVSNNVRTFTSTTALNEKLPIMGAEDIMSPKAHGTSEKAVMKDLKWGCDYDTADRICNFNRHYAEFAGYWATTKYLEEVDRENPTKYYDAVTGNHLFTAPVGRTMEEYLVESGSHGWPSFRDEEVNWDYVRVLPDGECVSITGTHLGHNIPDSKGNRYCINLVCVAGQPAEGQE
ncbi:hypothetical protein CTEN210_13838 [Chaetoceros tenuissimus]|uniref:Uncharacterized protein n=1 Tax=Chaetoceros tenuissimus TaxID=426638 RepID=A0AAD3HB53_9STRA|nr:hypothetical protein CTEN210_13838 [Chaetoceros tenuissimus]